MAPSKPTSESAPFKKEEKVLCFHHDMLYEAKVLDFKRTDDETSWQYKIHYKGWKNTWDDWAAQDRVRKFTDENKELAAQLHNQMKEMQKGSTKTATGKKRANGSDFSSARGSEERNISVATQNGRGGSRRNRDYDLEQSFLTSTRGISKNEQVEIDSRRLSTAREPWSIPGNHQWDILRVLHSADCLAFDALVIRPNSDHTYITANGHLKDADKYYKTSSPANGDHHKRSEYVSSRIRSCNSEVRGAPGTTVTSSSSSTIPQSSRITPHLTLSFQEDNFLSRPSIKLIIPDHVKAMLVDDWENVTKNQQLVPLPHAFPVNRILDDYLAFEMPKRPERSAEADILEEVVAGLKEYFDKCLGRILLYRFERPQYHEVRELWAKNDDPTWAGKTAGETYGAEHLSRLLVSLPELIAQTNMDHQSVNRLREELSKMTNWLGRNAVTYFVREYETPSQAYIDAARSI